MLTQGEGGRYLTVSSQGMFDNTMELRASIDQQAHGENV